MAFSLARARFREYSADHSLPAVLPGIDAQASSPQSTPRTSSASDDGILRRSGAAEPSASPLAPTDPRLEASRQASDAAIASLRHLFVTDASEKVHWYHQRDLRRSKLDRLLHDFSVEAEVGKSVISERKRTIVAPPMKDHVQSRESERQLSRDVQLRLKEEGNVGALALQEPADVVQLPFAPLPLTNDCSKDEADQLSKWIAERQSSNAAVEGMGTLPDSMPDWMRRKTARSAHDRKSRRSARGPAEPAAELRRRSSPDVLEGVSRPQSARSHRSSVSFDVGIGTSWGEAADILREFIRANRWRLHDLFARFKDSPEYYRLSADMMCHLLEAVGGLREPTPQEKQVIVLLKDRHFEGSLKPMTGAQLKRFVCYSGMDADGTVDYRTLVDDHRAREDLKTRMRQDRIRRRRNVLPARTLPEVHSAIGHGVQRGDPLMWLSDAENKERRDRAALRRRLAAEALERSEEEQAAAAARPHPRYGVQHSIEEQAAALPSREVSEQQRKSSFPHKLPWGWQGNRAWRSLSQMFDEDHPELKAGRPSPRATAAAPAHGWVGRDVSPEQQRAGADMSSTITLGTREPPSDGVVSERDEERPPTVRSSLAMPRGVDPGVLEGYIQRQRGEIERLTTSLVDSGVVASRRVLERALLTPADRPVYESLESLAALRQRAAKRSEDQ